VRSPANGTRSLPLNLEPTDHLIDA
jgi:hypothetical protein